RDDSGDFSWYWVAIGGAAGFLAGQLADFGGAAGFLAGQRVFGGAAGLIRILEIKFGKSPSKFDHPIENPSEINLLEINFGKSPDIIDVPGEDDDISDDEDPLPHDLPDSDVEDLINDDDGVE
ncbi:hypothetical protein Tco_0136896, partial [Tanacetum coccineum]